MKVLALQLTENLQRADLDPIDTAQAVVEYMKARHRDEAFDTDGIIHKMILVERDPERVKKEIVDTVSTILNISGKSLRFVQRACSLLKRPEAIDDGGPAVEAPKKKVVLL